MSRILFLFFIISTRLFSQNIDLNLDTAFADPSFYHKKYDLKTTEKIGGEGFELTRSSKLKHAFYGDFPGNSSYSCGSWTISYDSIVFSISDKRLVTKYGYNKRESYRPLLISWDLETDLKNNENRLLVLRNKLIVLNNEVATNELFNELRTAIADKLDKLKIDADPDDPFYFFQLNEKVINELYDQLYERKLFASIETLREYE